MLLPSERSVREPSEHDGRVFDVQPSRDDRSLDHPIRPLLSALGSDTAPLPYRTYWRRGPVLNQGREGACVGHGVTGELAAEPVPVKFPTANLPDEVPTDAQAFAFWLYHDAKFDDEWPGENYDGTSTNAGMRSARRLGLLLAWKWAETLDDFRRSVALLGPAVIAIPWHSGMYAAPGGLLRVSGQQVGWHCILVNGWHSNLSVAGSPRTEKFRVLNSWGTGWGRYGSAWIDAAELWSLIEDNDGEVVVPLHRELARII